MKEASLTHPEEAKRDLIVQNSKGTNMSKAGITQLFSMPVGSDRASSQEMTSGGTGKRQTTSQNMLAAAPMPLPRQSAAGKSSDTGPLPIHPPSSDSLDGEESQTSPGTTVTGKACGLLPVPSKKGIPKKDRSKLRKGKWTVRFYCDVSISLSFLFGFQFLISLFSVTNRSRKKNIHRELSTISVPGCLHYQKEQHLDRTSQIN